MSFAAFDSESQNGSPSQPVAKSDLANIISDTSSQLQTFSSLISTFANERKFIGTRRDNPQLRAKLDESQANIQHLGDAIQKLLSNVNVVVNSEGAKTGKGNQDRSDSQNGGKKGNQNGGKNGGKNGSKKGNKKGNKKGSESDSKSDSQNGTTKGNKTDSQKESQNAVRNVNGQSMMKDRIVREFTILQGTFQALSREYQAKKRANALPETTPLLEQKHPSSRPNSVQTQTVYGQNGKDQVQDQTQVQLQQDEVDESELQYHVLLTEERNRQIEQVQDGIREVNSIFKDLGELVNSQGTQLDTVEENILQMSGNAYSAERELTKANDYQKRKSKWSCILLCALCIFVLVIVLAVLS